MAGTVNPLNDVGSEIVIKRKKAEAISVRSTVQGKQINKTTSAVGLWQRLWKDDCGAIEASVYVLMTCLLGIGIIVSLATFRDQVVQEFGDIAESLESIDQSYSYTLLDQNNNPIKTVVFDENNPPAPVPGPAFPAASSEGAGGTAPADLDIFIPATNEL